MLLGWEFCRTKERRAGQLCVARFPIKKKINQITDRHHYKLVHLRTATKTKLLDILTGLIFWQVLFDCFIWWYAVFALVAPSVFKQEYLSNNPSIYYLVKGFKTNDSLKLWTKIVWRFRSEKYPNKWKNACKQQIIIYLFKYSITIIY